MSPDPATPTEPLVLFTAEDGIGTMTINRPAARNAMDQAVQAAVREVLDEVERREDVHVLIVTGAGDKAFVAGADIGEIASRGPLANRLAKTVIERAFDVDRETGLLLERLSVGILYAHTERDEGTAAFFDKRAPRYR